MGFPFSAYLASLAGARIPMNARPGIHLDVFRHLSANRRAHKAHNHVDFVIASIVPRRDVSHGHTRSFAP
jgi:hypothetical protein